jgi:transposase
MLNVDTIRKVRLAHRDGKSIREIARKLNFSRNTVRSILRSGITDQHYVRSEQPRPKLGTYIERLTEWLKEDLDKPVKHRRRGQILFEQLQREGYTGGYDAVRRFVSTWKKDAGTAIVNAFVPLEFDPGDAFQFDWSYEDVELGVEGGDAGSICTFSSHSPLKLQKLPTSPPPYKSYLRPPLPTVDFPALALRKALMRLANS